MNTESSHLSLTEKLHREATHNNDISGGNSPKRLKHPVVSPKPRPNHIHHAESTVTANHRNTPNRPLRDPVFSGAFHALYNIALKRNQVTPTS